MLAAPDGEVAAGYRLLRARLRRTGDPVVIAVSGPSAEAGELAANLALAFVEAHERVVLVDGREAATPLGALIGVPVRRLAIYEGGAPLAEAAAQLRHEYRRVVLAVASPPPCGGFDALLLVGSGPGRSIPDAAVAAAAGAAESLDRPGPSPSRYLAAAATSSVRVVWPDTAR
jgi:hypothetical protein